MNIPEKDETTTVAACPPLSGGLAAEKVWNRKWYMGFDYCPKCPKRFSEHDMNCIECCPVKRGEAAAANDVCTWCHWTNPFWRFFRGKHKGAEFSDIRNWCDRTSCRVIFFNLRNWKLRILG